ncbi:MAG TPA: SH3 domain-containing protein, partial [Geminicoccaceae bacterium]|nr:SH3 domain-containing protein [Geminicoccaceae bacterium]
AETQEAPEAATAGQTTAAEAESAEPPSATPSPEPVQPPEAASPPAAAVEPGAGPTLPAAAAEGNGRRYEVLTDVNYRQGPGNQYPRLGALAQGSTVAVVGEDKGWLQIRAPDGGMGFVYKKWLRAAAP